MVPSIEENLDRWDADYDWGEGGEPWSKPWGDATAQWFGCLYPRVRRFLPAETILEIAPGFGRWTEFLLGQCDTLIGVDVTPKCVEACRKRFSDRPQARFETNDGCSLPMVDDSSVDFAFSFDSLVHVEAEVLAGYLGELARVLRPEGVAFLHHSNYGTYQRSAHTFAPLQDTFDQLPAAAAPRPHAGRGLPGGPLAGTERDGGEVRRAGPGRRPALRGPRARELGGRRPAARLHLGGGPPRLALGPTEPGGQEPTVPPRGPLDPPGRSGLRRVRSAEAGPQRTVATAMMVS